MTSRSSDLVFFASRCLGELSWHNKRLVAISIEVGSLVESMMITVSVPNDRGGEDVYNLAFARARDIARHFCELPFGFPSEKAHRRH
jgi:hypothetical protein